MVEDMLAHGLGPWPNFAIYKCPIAQNEARLFTHKTYRIQLVELSLKYPDKIRFLLQNPSVAYANATGSAISAMTSS